MAHNIPRYSANDFKEMHVAGKLAAEVLDMITDHIEPGVTTIKLNDIIHKFIEDHGAVPATVGYRGYQHASCISVNHVVCHGIPSDKTLKKGDILNIDVTVIVNGWYGDNSRMYFVGEIDDISVKAQNLTRVTYECLMRSIDIVKPGTTLGDIGHAIQEHAEGHRFSVVEDFCGHGIGRQFHTQPQVVHFGQKGTGLRLEEGMIFTIEPMINAGVKDVKVLGDGWTAITQDRQLSAQFEHTLGVTSDGFEIFTLSPKGYTQPPYL